MINLLIWGSALSGISDSYFAYIFHRIRKYCMLAKYIYNIIYNG